MRRTLIVLLLGLSCAATVSGCGSEPGPSPSAPSSDASAGDPLTDPPITGKPGKPERIVTVTGVVSEGVEPGCLILDTGTRMLQLIGVRPADVPLGDRVVVTGSVQADLMTTCQQGTPFQVTAIRAED